MHLPVVIEQNLPVEPVDPRDCNRLEESDHEQRESPGVCVKNIEEIHSRSECEHLSDGEGHQTQERCNKSCESNTCSLVADT